VQQTGEYRIAAPRETVWAALNDPDVLARCIDGCEAMTRVGDSAFEATVKAKIGPVSATFKADLALSEVVPPESYTLTVNAKGGAAGFGKGVAKVALDEVEGGTLLRYSVDGSIGGKLAQVGSRLVDIATRKMADDFFAKFGAAVATPVAAQTPVADERRKPERFETTGQRVVWLMVFAALIVALILAL
jgi:carbon monoxide dehydrogenase subunit G